jgi:hypothetical protein
MAKGAANRLLAIYKVMHAAALIGILTSQLDLGE